MNTLVLLAEASRVMPVDFRLKVSTMMFLEFAIWGGWFVVLGNYLNTLGFSRKSIARIYATMPIGSIISPMFFGTIADQFLAAQHVMAIAHLVGGVLLLLLARIRTPRAFFWVALAYAILFAPTLSLVNVVYFGNFSDELQFPGVRVWGTIGWIVAGLALKLLIKPGEPVNNRPILMAAVLSFILGAFSFVLPDTKPGAFTARENYDKQIAELNERKQKGDIDQKFYDSGKREADNQLAEAIQIPFLRAVGMFREPKTAIFFIGTLIIAMAMAVYFAFAALFLEQGAKVKADTVGPVMTIGQAVEIFFLFTLGWFIQNWGMTTVLLVGMAGWALRFAFFTAGRPFALVLLGIALHGICFDFFFAAGMIYTTQVAPREIIASAQSLYGVLAYGLGMWLGTEAAGWLNQAYTRETLDPATGQTVRVTNWAMFWLLPCIVVTLALIAFLVFYGPTGLDITKR